MKLYPFYVLHDGQIVSAWEYRDDANEFIKEHEAEYGKFTIKTQAQLEKAGVKPGQRANWSNLSGHGHVVRNSGDIDVNVKHHPDMFHWIYSKLGTEWRCFAKGDTKFILGTVHKIETDKFVAKIGKDRMYFSAIDNAKKLVESKLAKALIKHNPSPEFKWNKLPGMEECLYNDLVCGTVSPHTLNSGKIVFYSKPRRVYPYKTHNSIENAKKYIEKCAVTLYGLKRNPPDSIQAKVDKIENEAYNHLYPILSKHGVTGSHGVAKTHAQKVAATAHKHLLNS